jgi:nucleoside phosphorylase
MIAKKACASHALSSTKIMAESNSWQGPRVTPGVLLSGDKLVDNIDYRDQLLDFEKEAIGGEMEGAGVYVANNEHKFDWIVIKAIVTGARGKKQRTRQLAKRRRLKL